MSGRERGPFHPHLPSHSYGKRWRWTYLYLVIMATVTFLAVIFDWTW